MRTLKLSLHRGRQRFLPVIVPALFLVLALRPGPAAALGEAPPGLPPQIIDVGNSHSCALTPTGAADCWTEAGAYGEGADKPGPYTQISTGPGLTCALTPAGAADCWGYGLDGRADDQPGPYIQIDAGHSHTCALTPSGAADCWGLNDVGQATDQPGPYTRISAGADHNCGLKPDGSADCWGLNDVGQATDQPGPYTQISAGYYHTCALTPSGAADCWGKNDYSEADDQTGPYTQINAGYFYTCALTPAGAVDCWGLNDYGQADDQTGPYTQVSATNRHTCALTPAGAADCWGLNGDGQADDQPGPYRPWEANEPNDTSGTATFLQYEETVRNNFIGVAGDVDRYYFQAFANEQFVVEIEAASLGSDLDSVLTFYGPDGVTVLAENDDANGRDSRLVVTIPATGYYGLGVRAFNNPGVGGPRHYYNLRIYPFSLYVSATKSGTVGSVATTPQDILRLDKNFIEWSMWFDGSDVGITQAVSSFARLPGGDWLLVFKANQPTPAGTFTPWDIARFTPSSMGDTTAGTFSWYFDGSDVGLSTSAEKIDALDWADGALLISTGGSLSVPAPGGTLKAQDEDLVAFYPTTTGANTAGEFTQRFDGTAVPGMKAEDLAAAHYDSTTGVLMGAITGSFKIGGVSGSGKDILILTPDASPGGYSAAKLTLPPLGFNLLVAGFEME